MLTMIQDKLRENPGGILFGVNALLAVILFFQYNPLGLFATGYAAASPLLDISQADVAKIEIRDPDFRGASGESASSERVVVTLTRQSELPREQWSATDEAGGVFSRAEPEFAWRLQIRRGENVQEFPADAERVAELFGNLAEARRHHYVPRSYEKDRDLEMGTDSTGRYLGLSLGFQLNDGEKHTLYVGRSSLRGNQSYLRLDDEKEVYLAETNLRSVAGPGEADYFRNRRLVPPNLKTAAVTGIHAEFADAAALVSLVKDGGVWRMQSPPIAGSVRADQVEQIAADIVEWKAIAFPGASGGNGAKNEVGVATSEVLKDFETPPEFPFVLRVEYTTPGNLTDRSELVFTVLGRKNFSNYLLRTSDGSLVEISSVFIEDLLNPREKLVDRQQQPGVSPLLQ
ncbi:MAG: DUF4340 domain-containing protein [bacterium]|nr:DUF4340 domain-containing protein [bacterium]